MRRCWRALAAWKVTVTVYLRDVEGKCKKSVYCILLGKLLVTLVFSGLIYRFVGSGMCICFGVGFTGAIESVMQYLDEEDDRKAAVEVAQANKRVLYHQTSKERARLILQDQTLRRGFSGLAGGGIYFAETAAETEQKAHRKGAVLMAVVALGNVKDVHGGDSSITAESLRRTGHHSVCISGRASGLEYVVYDSAQVTDIKLVDTRALDEMGRQEGLTDASG